MLPQCRDEDDIFLYESNFPKFRSRKKYFIPPYCSLTRLNTTLRYRDAFLKELDYSIGLTTLIDDRTRIVDSYKVAGGFY